MKYQKVKGQLEKYNLSPNEHYLFNSPERVKHYFSAILMFVLF